MLVVDCCWLPGAGDNFLICSGLKGCDVASANGLMDLLKDCYQEAPRAEPVVPSRRRSSFLEHLRRLSAASTERRRSSGYCAAPDHQWYGRLQSLNPPPPPPASALTSEASTFSQRGEWMKGAGGCNREQPQPPPPFFHKTRSINHDEKHVAKTHPL